MRFLFLLFFSIFIYAKVVVVTGIGLTTDQARKDALRQAVEEVVGSKIKSKTIVLNGRLDSDKIISNTDGLVKSYEELSRYKDEDGYYHVKLKVDISPKKVEKILNDFIKDKKSMREFNSENFKNRSVLVLYVPRGSNSLPKNSIPVETLLGTIEDELRDKSFDVVLQEDMPGMTQVKDYDSIENKKTALNFAKMAKADAIVLVTINKGVYKTGDGYNLVYVNILLKAYDATNRRLIANISERGKALAGSGKFGIDDGLSRAVEKVSKKATDELIKKIVRRMDVGSKDFIIVQFNNIPENIQDKILDILDDNGFDYKIVKQYNNTMKLKINSNNTATSFRRVLLKLFRKDGINLNTKRVEGNIIEFFKR
jgi:hypothetical protein